MLPVAGCGDETAEGMPLDEQTEMELALFMSLQNQEHIQAQAAATESGTESAKSESESESETSESESESEAESAESESTQATSGAESVFMPGAAQAESAAMEAATQAESAAMAAAAQAESAAMAAAAQAESAAMAAAAHAESAANAAVAQAESAATAAAAHATAAANTVAAHVEAAARSVDAALNHQAASVRGTMLSFADHLDGWWLRRPRLQQRGPQQQEGQQHRGPQQSGVPHRGPQHNGLPHRGPQQTEVQQRGPQQVSEVQQRGPQPADQAAHSPAPGGQAMTDGSGLAAISVAASDPVHQEEEVAEVAESPEQMQDSVAEATPMAVGVHSVSSDDSSFGSPVAPAPALPIDQFAALSLLDFDSVVPSFEDLDTPAGLDADDSPFDIHSEDQEGAASSHTSISHADQAVTDAGQVVPVIPWDATNADQDVRHSAEEIQDDAQVSYPRIDTSPLSASSEGSESPVHYPQVHRPRFQHPRIDFGQQVYQPSSPRNVDHAELPSPRTQMHLSALGSGAFSCQSSLSGDEAQHIGEYEVGDMTPAGASGGWPLDASMGGSAAWPLDVEDPAEAAASIHVHQGLHLPAVRNIARP